MFYQGFAFVHWTMTVEAGQIGWLGENWHASFREILLHAAMRYRLAYPTYCVMPDHLHLVCAGGREDSDQKPAIQFVRKHTNELL